MTVCMCVRVCVSRHVHVVSGDRIDGVDVADVLGPCRRGRSLGRHGSDGYCHETGKGSTGNLRRHRRSGSADTGDKGCDMSLKVTVIYHIDHAVVHDRNYTVSQAMVTSYFVNNCIKIN